MKHIATEIPDVILIEPRVFGDERGFFFESWNKRSLAEIGIETQGWMAVVNQYVRTTWLWPL